MRDKLILALKKIVYYNFNVFKYREKKAIESVSETTKHKERIFEDSKFFIGIIKEKWHLHSSFIKACQELKISYTIIDIFSENWLGHLESKPIDFLIVRPSVQYTPWKDMFDNRLKLLKRNSIVPTFPNIDSLWIWENKLRTTDFLSVNKLPHPKSYIFYDYGDLIKFSESCNYPIVYKASSGSGASGVKILKNTFQLRRIAKRVFNRGIRSYRKHKLDKEHGHIILQDYLQEVKEWRIVRIGDYYFGFEKLKEGDFHSGSKNFGYGMPPLKCLDLVREITENYDFKFVSIDIFITKGEEYLINEIQPYFGQKDDRELLRIDNQSGRLKYNRRESKWDFESGSFCKNNLCNLRVSEMIKIVKK